MSQALLLDNYLKRLRMPTVARLYPQVARDAEAEGQTYERFLLALMEAEVQTREANAQRERIKKARFPWGKDFEDYDFSAMPGLSRQRLLHLAEGEYLKRHENVIFVGNQGTGKTHLAVALGRAACRQGKRVLFIPAATLTNDLVEAQAGYRLSRLETGLTRIDLLVLDELGFVPFPPQAAQLLFGVLSSRYEQASTIITTNKAFSHWTDIFGDQALTGALLDRLTHHAHIVEVNGESHRFKQSLKRTEKA